MCVDEGVSFARERGCGIEKRISSNENNSGIEEEEIKYKKKKLLEVKSKTPSIVTPCPFALNKYSFDWQNHGPTISSLSITLLVLSKHWAACGFVSSTPSIVAYTFQANETKKGESNEPLNQYCRGGASPIIDYWLNTYFLIICGNRCQTAISMDWRRRKKNKRCADQKQQEPRRRSLFQVGWALLSGEQNESVEIRGSSPSSSATAAGTASLSLFSRYIVASLQPSEIFGHQCVDAEIKRDPAAVCAERNWKNRGQKNERERELGAHQQATLQ